MSRRIKFLAVLILAVWSSPAVRLESPVPRLLESPSGLSAPFDPGEQFVFEVNWKPLFFFPAFKAGEITLSVTESTFQGKATYRLQALAVSDGALTRVAGIEVRNYFESQIDRETFGSLRIFQQTREGSRHRDLEITFDYENERVSIHEEDPSTNPPRVLRHTIRKGIPGPAVDVISVFYIIRLRTLRPGDQFLIDLNERGDFRQVRIVTLENERVRTPLGSFPSVKLTSTGGLFRQGGEFRAWYGRDLLRTPTRFEADVRFGKVYGHLIRLTTPSLTRSIEPVR